MRRINQIEASGDAHPGIDFHPGVCGGSARIIRTRIPVWLLDALRRDGSSEAELHADKALSVFFDRTMKGKL